MAKNQIYMFYWYKTTDGFVLWWENIITCGRDRKIILTNCTWMKFVFCLWASEFGAFGRWQFLCKSRINPGVEIHNFQPCRDWSCVTGTCRCHDETEHCAETRWGRIWAMLPDLKISCSLLKFLQLCQSQHVLFSYFIAPYLTVSCIRFAREFALNKVKPIVSWKHHGEVRKMPLSTVILLKFVAVFWQQALSKMCHALPSAWPKLRRTT